MEGVPIHQTDKHGVPILAGDTVVCYPPNAWEAAVRFVVDITADGLNLPAGLLPSDLSLSCEVVERG